MGFKVLEVNASATCNGRQVLANLGGTSQIHNVRGYLMLCPRKSGGGGVSSYSIKNFNGKQKLQKCWYNAEAINLSK